jgi:hypothetical protein
MRKFVSKISLFLFVPILLSILLDIFISNKLKDSKVFPCENEVWNDIYSSSINADIAVYGSSRAWVQFDPKIIADSLHVHCYNFGEDGSNIMLQYVRHKEYLRFNLPPKLIILSVDMFTFQKINIYPKNSFYPYAFFNKSVYSMLESIHVNCNKSIFYVPLLRYLKSTDMLKSFFKPDKLPYFKLFDKYFDLNDNGKLRNNGFRGMELTWRDDSYKKLSYEVSIDSSLIALMANFIKEVKQDGMDLIMVYAPEYYEGQNIIKNRNEMMSVFDNLSSKYKIPFFDYSDSSISKRKELFYNVEHLNKTGSEIFTQQFIMDMKAQGSYKGYKK